MDDFAKSIGAIPRTQQEEDEFAKSIGASPRVPASQPEVIPSETESPLQTFGKQMLDVGTFDFGGEIAGALAHPADAATAIGNLFRDKENQQNADDYYNYVKEYEQNLEAGKEANPIARWTGAAAGLVPGIVSGGAIMRGLGAVGGALPGAAKVIQAGAESAPLLSRLGSFAAKSIPTGAAFGALQGMGAAETGEVGQGAVEGAKLGAVAGPLVEAGITGAGKGISGLRKFSPHLDETLTSFERGLAGVDYSDVNKLEKVANEASKANTEEYNAVTGKIVKALGQSKALAADLPVEEAIAPIKKGLESQKYIKAVTTAPEDLASTQAELNNLKTNLADTITSKKSKIQELQDQLAEVRKAKQTAQNEALLSSDDTIAEKALSSMDSMAQTESQLIKQTRDLQNSIQSDIANLGSKSESLNKRAAELADEVANPVMEYPSEFKSDASKLEAILSEVPRATAIEEGVIPANKIEQLLTNRIKELQSLGDNALNTANGRKIANEVRDLIREHYTGTAPNFEELNKATSELLSAKGLMGGLEKTGDIAADAAKQFKYTQGLAKTVKPGQSGMKAREMFSQADEHINRAISELSNSENKDLRIWARQLENFKNNRSGVTQSLEDAALAQKLNNPNLPFYKTIAQKGANVVGLGTEKTGLQALTERLTKSNNGEYLQRVSESLRAKNRVTAANLAEQLATTQDAGKKKAIINVIQNSATLRQIFSDILGVEDGEQVK